MPSNHNEMFATAASPLIENQFGVSVVLERFGVRSAPFLCRRNRDRDRQIESEFTSHTNTEIRIFHLPVSSCVIGGVPVKPAVGNRIIEDEQIFEILPVEDKPAVESKTNGQDWRVYTKRIE